MKQRKLRTALYLAFALGSVMQAPLSIANQKNYPSLAELTITEPKLKTIHYGLESVEHWVSKLSVNDPARATKLANDLNKQADRLSRVKGAAEAEVILLKNYIAELMAYLNKVESGQLDNSQAGTTAAARTSAVHSSANTDSAVTREISNLERQFDSWLGNFDSPRVSGMQLQEKFDRMVEKFERIPVSSHPDYVGLFDKFVLAGKRLPERNPDIGMPVEQVSQYIATLQERYRDSIPVVQFTAEGELTAESVDEYLSRLTAVSVDRDRDLPLVKKIVLATGEGRYLLNWLEKDAIDEVRRNNERFDQLLQSNINYRRSQLEKLASLDPVKNAYAFGDEAKRQKNEAAFTQVLGTLRQAARLQSTLWGGSSYADQAVAFERQLEDWRAKFDHAKSSRTLPVAIVDEELSGIAESVLLDDKYGVGKWKKLIVNADIRPGESIEHKLTDKGLVTIIKNWEEYQVATVEEEAGKLYLYYNTLRKFSRAPRTTPVNRWILAKRHNSGEIESSLIN
ncbi:MAG: hypothetical protein KTR32_39275 [Granulosicoccus sp.]|nr:hypothetical protein [Granulosicoccus sp.]